MKVGLPDLVGGHSQVNQARWYLHHILVDSMITPHMYITCKRVWTIA